MDFVLLLINGIAAFLQYAHYAQTGSKTSRFFFILCSMLAGYYAYRLMIL